VAGIDLAQNGRARDVIIMRLMMMMRWIAILDGPTYLGKILVGSPKK
jgi:hypothetical protein